MKRIIWVLLGLSVMVACSQSDKQLISDAEAQVGEHPDSALLILNKVKNLGRLSDEWVARFWLTTAAAHAGTSQSLSEDSAVTFALDYYSRQQPVDSFRLRQARAFCSSYYWWTGQQKKARQLMAASLEESRRNGNREEQMSLLHGMAELTLMDNDEDEASRYVEEYIKMDGGDINHANLLNNLALLYYLKGNDSTATTLLERAIAHVDTAADSTYIWRDVMRNYADLLITTGQVDRGIDLQERILKHYQQTGMKNEIVGSLLSLSYAWLLKGDKQKARHYYELMEKQPNDTDDYGHATQYCIIGHRMVLDYATTGHYNITDMAYYANDMQGKSNKKEAVAAAKERAMQQLREHDLWLTVSRQRQFIFFLLLTVGLSTVILGLIMYLKRRRRLLREKEEETEALRKLLADSLHANANDDRFVKKIMLQQLGVIRHAAANPTVANQQLLQRMTDIACGEVNVDSLLNWDDLYKTIDSVYDGYYSRLCSRHGLHLNEKDIQLCCLLKANFSTKEISFVTQQSVRTVYQRKTQVRQKLGLEEKEDIAEATD